LGSQSHQVTGNTSPVGAVEAAQAVTLGYTGLMSMIHGTDIYRGFDTRGCQLDIGGGHHSNNPQLADVLASHRPDLIIEVGTWKGRSAIHMAQVAQRLQLKTLILCVDTWLGALEQLLDKDKVAPPEERLWYTSLNYRHGYPQLYYQFLYNVVASGLEKLILPFANTSLIAARWFKSMGVTADMIYIGGSHLYEDAWQDIANYFPLLNRGGVLCGDDYQWPDVKAAVEERAESYGLSVQHPSERFWLIETT